MEKGDLTMDQPGTARSATKPRSRRSSLPRSLFSESSSQRPPENPLALQKKKIDIKETPISKPLSRTNSVSSNVSKRQFAPEVPRRQTIPEVSDSTPIDENDTRDNREAKPSKEALIDLSESIKNHIALAKRHLGETGTELSEVLTNMENDCKSDVNDITGITRFLKYLGGKAKDRAVERLRKYASMSESLMTFAVRDHEARSYVKLTEASLLGLDIESITQCVSDLPKMKEDIARQHGRFVTNYCRDYRQFNRQATVAPEVNYQNRPVEYLTDVIKNLKYITDKCYKEQRKTNTNLLRVVANQDGKYGQEEKVVHTYLDQINQFADGKILPDGETLSERERENVRHRVSLLKILYGAVRGNNEVLTGKEACKVFVREIRKIEDWVREYLGIQPLYEL